MVLELLIHLLIQSFIRISSFTQQTFTEPLGGYLALPWASGISVANLPPLGTWRIDTHLAGVGGVRGGSQSCYRELRPEGKEMKQHTTGEQAQPCHSPCQAHLPRKWGAG